MYPEDVMGIGSYVGELRQSPDGQLYQWVEGVDGFGNPMGFWKVIRAIGRGIRKVARIPLVRRLLPVAAGLIPGIGPAAAAGITAAQSAGILGADPELSGMGSYVGEMAQGPDGQLYQWVDTVDGFGNPIGFWKALRSIGRGIRKFTRIPLVRRLLPAAAGLIPGIGPAAAAGITAAQSAGFLGQDYYGHPY